MNRKKLTESLAMLVFVAGTMGPAERKRHSMYPKPKWNTAPSLSTSMKRVR